MKLKSYKQKIWGKEGFESFLSWKKNRFIFLESFKSQSVDLPDLGPAIKRIQSALNEKERVMVFGDFDADGITSTVVWLTVLKALGALVSFRIPDREKDSHGLKKHHIDELLDLKIDLVITCDCGVNDAGAISYAKSLGIDVIVTDHHISEPNLFPKDAVAVVNPQRGVLDDLKKLAGVGVSYFMCEALVKKQDFCLWDSLNSKLLELVAIGTVADCMQLHGTNRRLVQEGLKSLQKSKWPALRTFFTEFEISNINEETIGFQIAPRINAASRLGDARVPVFLITGEAEKISERLQYLNGLNEERKQLSEKMFQESLAQIDLKSKYCFVFDTSWKPGLLGLLAGKICEKYGKPTIACTQKDGRIHASCRGPKGQNLMEGLSKCSDLFIYFGGHAQAAGFQMESSKKSELMTCLDDFYAENNFEPEPLVADSLLLPQEFSLKTVESLQELRPFGMGNVKPRFLLKNCELQEINMMGREKNHARLSFMWDDQMITTVWFSVADICDYVQEFEKYDLVVELGENTWQGNRRLEVFGVDLRLVSS